MEGQIHIETTRKGELDIYADKNGTSKVTQIYLGKVTQIYLGKDKHEAINALYEYKNKQFKKLDEIKSKINIEVDLAINKVFNFEL